MLQTVINSERQHLHIVGIQMVNFLRLSSLPGYADKKSQNRISEVKIIHKV